MVQLNLFLYSHSAQKTFSKKYLTMKNTSKIMTNPARRFVLRCIALCSTTLLPLAVQAQLKIDITGVGANQIAVSAAPFEGNQAFAEDIRSIVESDLTRSGFFKTIKASSNVQLNESSPVDAPSWKSVGVDAVVAGSVKKSADGLDIRFQLFDTTQQKSLAKINFSNVSPTALRLTAHKIADIVYEKLLGEKGMFATRIAYVEKSSGRYRLVIADSDGANPQVALTSREPIISPAWSPDGNQLAYVSFETKKPVVFVHTLSTGQRRPLANYKGSNSAPAWSKNGKRLAVVLTKDGGSHIYTLSTDGSNLERLTTSGSINTEPAFAPDGQSIYFTIDRGAGPQIYKMNTQGGNQTRVTFEGNFNISPRISPDGKTLTYIARRDGQFKVAALDLSSGQEMVLTNTGREESPSFAPNSRFILYATNAGGRGTLALVSRDGRIRNTLTSSAGDISEPTWGPFTND